MKLTVKRDCGGEACASEKSKFCTSCKSCPFGPITVNLRANSKRRLGRQHRKPQCTSGAAAWRRLLASQKTLEDFATDDSAVDSDFGISARLNHCVLILLASPRDFCDIFARLNHCVHQRLARRSIESSCSSKWINSDPVHFCSIESLCSSPTPVYRPYARAAKSFARLNHCVRTLTSLIG